MSVEEEYKYFIENCTNASKSYKNYSDFSRSMLGMSIV